MSALGSKADISDARPPMSANDPEQTLYVAKTSRFQRRPLCTARGHHFSSNAACGMVCRDEQSCKAAVLYLLTLTPAFIVHLALLFARRAGRGRGRPSTVTPDGQSLHRELRWARRGCRWASGQTNGVTLEEGDWISLDGDTGEVFLGQREIMTERPEDELAEVERWRADTAALELAK
jgi:hypothetical protein